MSDGLLPSTLAGPVNVVAGWRAKTLLRLKDLNVSDYWSPSVLL